MITRKFSVALTISATQSRPICRLRDSASWLTFCFLFAPISNQSEILLSTLLIQDQADYSHCAQLKLILFFLASLSLSTLPFLVISLPIPFVAGVRSDWSFAELDPFRCVPPEWGRLPGVELPDIADQLMSGLVVRCQCYDDQTTKNDILMLVEGRQSLFDLAVSACGIESIVPRLSQDPQYIRYVSLSLISWSSIESSTC